jgi:hypothetical protein
MADGRKEGRRGVGCRASVGAEWVQDIIGYPSMYGVEHPHLAAAARQHFLSRRERKEGKEAPGVGRVLL